MSGTEPLLETTRGAELPVSNRGGPSAEPSIGHPWFLERWSIRGNGGTHNASLVSDRPWKVQAWGGPKKMTAQGLGLRETSKPLQARRSPRLGRSSCDGGPNLGLDSYSEDGAGCL